MYISDWFSKNNSNYVSEIGGLAENAITSRLSKKCTNVLRSMMEGHLCNEFLVVRVTSRQYCIPLIQTSFILVLFFFFNSVLRPFQDYFSSYETGQSVGGRKREDPEKNHLAHPQAELGLSHMWPVRGSNPHQTQR